MDWRVHWIGIPRAGTWLAASALIAALAAGCSTARVTEPPETATEQLLITDAIDKALERLAPVLPPDSPVFVDGQFVDNTPRYPKYLVGAVRDRLLRQGVRLVEDRKTADLIVEVRTGAQSVDHDGFLIGIPALPVPVPPASTVSTPEVALFKKDQRLGVAKIALTAYRRDNGTLVAAPPPVYGVAERTHWSVLIFFSWTEGDVRPETLPR